MTKILAIHDNKSFLRDDTPSFYGYLAKSRGVGEEVEKLGKEWAAQKEKGPKNLRESFELSAGGMDLRDFEGFCRDFLEKYGHLNGNGRLANLWGEFEKIWIFTSLPAAIYADLADCVNGVFGVTAETDENNKIVGIADSDGFGEPNRHGLTAKLENLIDEIPDQVRDNVEVFVVGVGEIKKSIHEFSAVIFDDLRAVK